MKLQIKLLFLLLFNLAVIQNCYSAACCGGGLASTFLITGDNKAQINSSYSYNKIDVDIDEFGYWRERKFSESLETFRFEGAHIFFDRFQGGLSIPLIRRTRGSETSTGLGDLSATAGYEYLTNWSYHPWRPKGFGYLNLIVPTGVFLEEASDAYLLDTRGRGFWTVGAGTLLTKTFGNFDFFTDLGIHRSFNRDFQNNQTQGTLIPGWGGNFAIGSGINFSSLRLGINISWIYEDPVSVEGQINSLGYKKRFTSVDFPITYFFSDEWLGVIRYTDRGLIGNPVNTSLDKALTLQVQRNWPR